MNKSELVAKIAEGADITKASAGRALDSLIYSVTAELASAGDVALVGFGIYKVNDRTAPKHKVLYRMTNTTVINCGSIDNEQCAISIIINDIALL